MKGRSRLLETLRACREGRLSDITPQPDEVEILILCRGARNAVERNRIRRRVREAIHIVLRERNISSGVFVVKAGREFLNMEWNELKRRMIPGAPVPDASVRSNKLTSMTNLC